MPYDELAGQITQALGGHVVSISAGPAGLTAALWTQDSFPPWYHVVIWSGSLQAMTPSQPRVWGNPCWSASGVLAVTAFDGTRRGIVTIDPGDGRTRWWSRPASSSYRLLALAAGGQDSLAVRSDHDGSAWLVRAVHGGADHRLQILRPVDGVPVSVVTWSNDGITLEGLLAAAAGTGPQRLLVLLHGGPVGGLVCGDHPDPSAWVSAGFTVFIGPPRPGTGGKHKSRCSRILARSDRDHRLTGAVEARGTDDLSEDRAVCRRLPRGATLIPSPGSGRFPVSGAGAGGRFPRGSFFGASDPGVQAA